jgi:hypothetical protein
LDRKQIPAKAQGNVKKHKFREQGNSVMLIICVCCRKTYPLPSVLIHNLQGFEEKEMLIVHQTKKRIGKSQSIVSSSSERKCPPFKGLSLTA